jgi:hypothetical protein
MRRALFPKSQKFVCNRVKNLSREKFDNLADHIFIPFFIFEGDRNNDCRSMVTQAAALLRVISAKANTAIMGRTITQMAKNRSTQQRGWNGFFVKGSCARIERASGLLVFVLALANQPALAQVMPAPVPLSSANPAQPLYYKDGNGPTSSYFQRWIPSNNGCSNLTKGTDIVSQYTNSLKCIPLGTGGNSYVTLNGTERFRNENLSHSGLHVAPSTAANGTPLKNTTANQSERWMTHSEGGADLHLDDHFRVYGQIDNGTQSGRQIVNPGPSAANRNTLALMALFGEGKININDTPLATPALNDTILGLRIGRENTGFGSDTYWSAVNGGTNLAGGSLDGIRAYADQGPRRLDLFAYHFVNEINLDPRGGREPFLDRDNAKELYWGAYFSNDLPRYRVLGMDTKTGIDAFYYGYSNGAAQYTNRNLLKNQASLAIAPGGASFITAHDYRHSVGLRFYGDIGNFDADWSGIIQRGSFGKYDVDAWAFHTSTGYNFPLPWKPWLGLWLDGASGGVSKDSNTMQTFQPMRQNAYAISTISVSQALSNLIDVSPRIAFAPDFYIGSFHVEKMGVSFWYSFYFRQNQNDAVYAGTYFGNQTAPGANPYQITAVSRGQFIGQQPNVRLYWAFAPHFNYGIDAAYEFVGPALKVAGAKDTLYIRNQLIFDF